MQYGYLLKADAGPSGIGGLMNFDKASASASLGKAANNLLGNLYFHSPSSCGFFFRSLPVCQPCSQTKKSSGNRHRTGAICFN